jgi:predicted DNA-binding transcriptional regulator YafY
MRRADRLFDIIQALRTAPHPVTAAALAEQLEVTARTTYRDNAALQGNRVPIEGAPGLGYVLRRGFDLPPSVSSQLPSVASALALLAASG